MHIDKKRFNELYSVFLGVCEEYITHIPVQPLDICKAMNIKVLPLRELISASGLKDSDIFDIWGNDDGVINSSDCGSVITFNDRKPARRIRFTISEELMHYIFKHSEDDAFDINGIFDNEDVYARYENEAKIFAGLLLCPPRFYEAFGLYCNAERISRWCDVSESCASKIIEDYSVYSDRIFAHPKYLFTKNPMLTREIREELFRLRSN